MSDNAITITGNLTRDPELRFTASGTASCSLSVAVNRRYQKDGEWQDAPTNFFNAVCFGQLAENVAASLTKGDRVQIAGRLDFRKYTNKEGVEVSTHDVVADDVCPSLKYATATVQRTERTGGSSGKAKPAATQEEPF